MDLQKILHFFGPSGSPRSGLSSQILLTVHARSLRPKEEYLLSSERWPGKELEIQRSLSTVSPLSESWGAMKERSKLKGLFLNGVVKEKTS